MRSFLATVAGPPDLSAFLLVVKWPWLLISQILAQWTSCRSGFHKAYVRNEDKLLIIAIYTFIYINISTTMYISSNILVVMAISF